MLYYSKTLTKKKYIYEKINNDLILDLKIQYLTRTKSFTYFSSSLFFEDNC